MSQFNKLKDMFKQIYERRKDIVEYWKKSPTTKIVLINTGVYVKAVSYEVYVEI